MCTPNERGPTRGAQRGTCKGSHGPQRREATSDGPDQGSAKRVEGHKSNCSGNCIRLGSQLQSLWGLAPCTRQGDCRPPRGNTAFMLYGRIAARQVQRCCDAVVREMPLLSRMPMHHAEESVHARKPDISAGDVDSGAAGAVEPSARTAAETYTPSGAK